MQLAGSWLTYVTVLVPFTLISLVISFNLQMVYSALAWISRKIRMKRLMFNGASRLESSLPIYNKTT